MSVVIGGEEKAKKEFEASSMLKTIFLMFFYENRVATHSGQFGFYEKLRLVLRFFEKLRLFFFQILNEIELIQFSIFCDFIINFFQELDFYCFQTVDFNYYLKCSTLRLAILLIIRLKQFLVKFFFWFNKNQGDSGQFLVTQASFSDSKSGNPVKNETF